MIDIGQGAWKRSNCVWEINLFMMAFPFFWPMTGLGVNFGLDAVVRSGPPPTSFKTADAQSNKKSYFRKVDMECLTSKDFKAFTEKRGFDVAAYSSQSQ